MACALPAAQAKQGEMLFAAQLSTFSCIQAQPKK
jgi:hypothetical protein